MYDVIVVGARCAGSPTAMLLAGNGHRVLLVDKARFPKDTVSTLYIHQPGVARLERWGLLDRLRATGCPPLHRKTAWPRCTAPAGRCSTPSSRTRRPKPVPRCGWDSR